ncbi:hypothetical protein ACYATL_03600 [Actinotignum timonense]|uniref:hypothetical protein n=1 Tax=Actinotignum TaxID=1653174 RepID=UPI00254E5948|nr:hypothetical protein [Actinotignum timonense]MDK6591235.1 hypothetical protein [Actinotignum timonense]MDK6628695.1 hypothetical protein [Actinotignum timonense]MDK6906721.1 hypothetical protein [Actinotignum timonense]MDK8781859.1 hypothetical protein [Actinotignum timonense]
MSNTFPQGADVPSEHSSNPPEPSGAPAPMPAPAPAPAPMQTPVPAVRTTAPLAAPLGVLAGSIIGFIGTALHFWTLHMSAGTQSEDFGVKLWETDTKSVAIFITIGLALGAIGAFVGLVRQAPAAVRKTWSSGGIVGAVIVGIYLVINIKPSDADTIIAYGQAQGVDVDITPGIGYYLLAVAAVLMLGFGIWQIAKTPATVASAAQPGTDAGAAAQAPFASQSPQFPPQDPVFPPAPPAAPAAASSPENTDRAESAAPAETQPAPEPREGEEPQDPQAPQAPQDPHN